MQDNPKIICISNRLPIAVYEEADKTEIRPSSGGLVTAMGPVLSKSRGVWIGWPGSIKESEEEVRIKLKEFSSQSEFELFPVILDQESVSGFYEGFSNQIIWPLFHDLQSRCNFEPGFWSTYLRVQDIFRDETKKHIQHGDLVWVHDYHMLGLGRSLRNEGVNNKICFFLHTPFPGPDIFMKLPWRDDVIESLLTYDLIGFQTRRDLKNFTDCVDILTKSNCVNRGALWFAKTEKREVAIGNFPISIDFNEFADNANTREVENKAAQIRSDMNVDFLVLSIDRLDYTKGIPYRIRAFKHLLEQEPDFKKRVALLQVVVPSRVEVPEYKQLLNEIEQLVSELNGAHAEPGWVPVHHLFRSLNREEVIAMYRASDVALVTPLKDGMNLVAKEYCACRLNDRGSLILSEFAGAADELGEYSYLVNPYDIEKIAGALKQAFYDSKIQQKASMHQIRELLKQSDVFNWAHSFIRAAGWEWKSYESGPRPATIWDRLRNIANVLDL